MTKLLVLTICAIAFACSAAAQTLQYRVGTIFGNGALQGYHVVGVNAAQINDRVDFEWTGWTPWQFGEAWTGPGVLYRIPGSHSFRATTGVGIALVAKVDGAFQPLSNLRGALNFWVSF